MPRPVPSRLPGWLGGSGAIAVAMAVMNVTAYAFTILAARLLGPTHYGALAAMMGLILVLNVVALGLQATAARRVSAAPEQAVSVEGEILAAGTRAALALGGLCLLATPAISAGLRLDSWGTAALVGVTVVPLTVMGAQAGVLQGERRWLPLAWVYLASGVGRLAFGALGLLWRPDAFGAMVGVAVGALVPVVVGWLALRRPRQLPSVAEEAGAAPTHGGLYREVAHNSHALLAFFALSSADVVLARVVLDSHQAGLYAGGLILTKAVLFLPQFVVVIAFPSMAAGGERGLHLRGLGMVLAIGLACAGGAAVLSGLAVAFVGGGEYAAIENQLWAFALLGTVLAMVQLMTYHVVARQQRGSVYLIWAALAALLVLGAPASTETALLTTVIAVDTALLVVLLAVSLRPARAADVRRGARPSR